jgi:putative ABC transport system permease protein
MALSLPLRNVTRNKWRTILILTGIAISVGLETGIAISIDSLYSDFIDSHRGENFTDITIHPKSDTTLEDIRAVKEKVKQVRGVKKVSPVATSTLLEEIPSLEDVPNNVILYGVEPSTHPDFPDLQIVDGNKTIFGYNILISESIAKFLNVDPGIKYIMPEVQEYDFLGATVLIAGSVNDQIQFGNFIGFLFILLDIDFLARLFVNNTGLDYHLVVQVDDFVNINAIAEELDDTVGLDYNIYREKSLSENDILAIRSYQVAMNLLIIASFAIEFLFITNILAINIKERSKEFGIMRAVGTSANQIKFLVAAEILIYGGLGSFLGNILGIGFSALLILFLNISFPQKISIDVLVLNPNSLITTFITGNFIALLAGLYPILIAISFPIVQNIHWQMRGKKRKKRNWIYLILTGFGLTLGGIISTYFIGPTRFLEIDVISWHFFAVWSIFIGTLLIEIGILTFLPKIGMKLMWWHRRVPRTIATRNIGREFQKSTITILVASLALTFVLVVGILSSAIINSVPTYYDDRFGRIDVIAQTNDDANIPPTFANELVDINSEIDKAAFMQQQRSRLADTEAYVFGIDPDSYKYYFEETMLLPANPNITEMLSTSQKGIILSHFLLDRIGTRIGDNLTLQVTENTSIQVLVTGITFGNPFLQHGNYLYCSSSVYQNLWGNDSATWFIMTASKEVSSLNSLADQLTVKYPFFSEVIAVDFYSKVIENSLIVQTAFFQMLFYHSFILSGLAQFICILISTQKMEREMGIMRALGLSKREVFSTFLAESTLLGTTGVMIGLVNGAIASGLLTWYIRLSIPIETRISIPLLMFWVLISLFITILSTIIPSYRSSHKNIAYTIHSYIPRQIKANAIVWGPGWDKYLDRQLEERVDIASPYLRKKQQNNKE